MFRRLKRTLVGVAFGAPALLSLSGQSCFPNTATLPGPGGGHIVYPADTEHIPREGPAEPATTTRTFRPVDSYYVREGEISPTQSDNLVISIGGEYALATSIGVVRFVGLEELRGENIESARLRLNPSSDPRMKASLRVMKVPWVPSDLTWDWISDSDVSDWTNYDVNFNDRDSVVIDLRKQKLPDGTYVFDKIMEEGGISYVIKPFNYYGVFQEPSSPTSITVRPTLEFRVSNFSELRYRESDENYEELSGGDFDPVAAMFDPFYSFYLERIRREKYK